MRWDIVLLQELHVMKFNMIQMLMRFCQVYPADRWKEGAVVQSTIWVNAEIDTKLWKIIKVLGTNDITAIQMEGPYGKLIIFNIYNSCMHSLTKTILRHFLCDNANDIWHRQDFHMLWCSDFNRHHPLWDRDKDTHLFTAEALWKAGSLIKLLVDYDMEMILAKGVPTLQHMRSKHYSRPDNIFCNSSMTSMVIQCDINARAHPTKTDHFPIIMILELPQERIKLKPMYI